MSMSEKRPNDVNEENEVMTGEVEESTTPKTGFALRVEQMSDAEWDKWTIVAGVVLALAAAGFLFLYPSSEGSAFSMGPILALAVAMILPGYAERRLERRAPKLRIALIITLSAAIVIYLAVMLLTGQASQ